MKYIFSNKMIALTAMVVLGAGIPAAVNAQEDSPPIGTETPSIKRESQATVKEEARAGAKERLAQAAHGQDVKKERLEGRKLKACQNREKAVTNIMSRIGDRGQKQVDLFTKIADRTQKFYADKGLSLSNYDALAADVAAKKTAAEAAVAATKSTTVQFKCDGDNPKGTAEHFKSSMKRQNEALKAYKTSVKNLIVGVKSSKSTAGGQQ